MAAAHTNFPHPVRLLVVDTPVAVGALPGLVPVCPETASGRCGDAELASPHRFLAGAAWWASAVLVLALTMHMYLVRRKLASSMYLDTMLSMYGVCMSV